MLETRPVLSKRAQNKRIKNLLLALLAVGLLLLGSSVVYVYATRVARAQSLPAEEASESNGTVTCLRLFRSEEEGWHLKEVGMDKCRTWEDIRHVEGQTARQYYSTTGAIGDELSLLEDISPCSSYPEMTGHLWWDYTHGTQYHLSAVDLWRHVEEHGIDCSTPLSESGLEAANYRSAR